MNKMIDKTLKQRKDESFLLWKMRLCYGKINHVEPYNISWDDMVKVLNLNVHPDTLRKLGYAYAETYEELILEGNGETKELKQMILDMKKEKVKLSDERKECNRQIRELGRIESLSQLLLKNMDNLTPLKNSPSIEISNDSNEGVLMLSDIHYGLEINTPLNTYGIDESRKRIKILVEKVSNECERQDVNILHIFCLGDLISGVIHNTIRLLNRELLTEQIIHISEIISEIIEIFSKKMIVKVYIVQGNHERIFEKDNNLSKENYTELIKYYVKNRVKNLVNVEFKDTFNEEILIADIKGYKFIGCHGDKLNKKQAGYELMGVTGVSPNYICLGHYHVGETFMEYEVPIFINGCVCGTDEYAYNKKLYAYATQKLLIVNNNGVECCYDFVLNKK